MKGKDFKIFIAILVVSFVIGFFLFDKNFKGYAELITFLAIMVGFEITSLSILFNSPLKKSLWNRKNHVYRTELHRLSAFYKHALYFEIICIILVFFIPNESSFEVKKVFIGKYLIVPPIILGTFFCFYKICNDLFLIFTYPTND